MDLSVKCKKEKNLRRTKSTRKNIVETLLDLRLNKDLMPKLLFIQENNYVLFHKSSKFTIV